VLSGTDPKKALEDSEKSLEGPIKNYNQSVGG
jgi:hypothetical protein